MNARTPPSEDDVPLDELMVLPVAAPRNVARTVGYDGDAQYLALWWTPFGDELMVSDGYRSQDGDWQWFSRWDSEAGKAFLETVMQHSSDDRRPPLSETSASLRLILTDIGYNIGSSDSEGNAALLIERDTRRVYVGGREHVREFIERFNNPPDGITELPSEPTELKRLFDRLSDSNTSIDDFFDRSDDDR